MLLETGFLIPAFHGIAFIAFVQTRVMTQTGKFTAVDLADTNLRFDDNALTPMTDTLVPGGEEGDEDYDDEEDDDDFDEEDDLDTEEVADVDESDPDAADLDDDDLDEDDFPDDDDEDEDEEDV